MQTKHKIRANLPPKARPDNLLIAVRRSPEQTPNPHRAQTNLNAPIKLRHRGQHPVVPHAHEPGLQLPRQGQVQEAVGAGEHPP